MKMTVFKCLTSMACSCFENWDFEDDATSQKMSMSRKVQRVIHAGAISAVIELLPSLWEEEEGAEEKNEVLGVKKVFINVFGFHFVVHFN